MTELFDKKGNYRTYVEGELAIKPYFYLRNGRLHIRYNVDRAIELSDAEVERLKKDLTTKPSYKQAILAKAWYFFEKIVCKPIIHDGLTEMENKGLFKHGRKN